jgi:hypothetical protein
MSWKIEIESKQVREFCAATCQPVSGVATVLLGTALDAGADAVEVAADSVRFRIGGEWRPADPMPAHVVPAVCAFLLLVGTSSRPEGTVTLCQNGQRRQLHIDTKALKISLAIG